MSDRPGSSSRVAVVLFNLGGPDSLAAVGPFLRNLFSDPAILSVPGPVRWLLARWISHKRKAVAAEIYRHLGGGSPLLPNTLAQARALEQGWPGPEDVRVFVAMRYWHPRADAVVAQVKAWGPDRVVLLPLYPQHSTTTTASSVAEWRQEATRQRLTVPESMVCCYPAQAGLVQALTALTAPLWQKAREQGPARVLFSAHGLPERVARRGDPYPAQCQRTAAAVAAALGLGPQEWVLCFQSRVGPMKWIGPETAAEIRRAGTEKVSVVVVPVAFVSEHSETLVELDQEYRALAQAEGVPGFDRVPTAGTHPDFIAGLVNLVRESLDETMERKPCGAARCPLQANGEEK